MKPIISSSFNRNAAQRSWRVLLLTLTLPWVVPGAVFAEDVPKPPVAATAGGTAATEPGSVPQALERRYQATTRGEQVGAGTQYVNRLQRIVKDSGGSGPIAGSGLIILSSPVDAQEQANLQEDLAIMSHLFDKVIDDTLGADQRMRKALGVDLWFPPDGSSPRNSYLEGYGALFLLRVDFPLLPGPGQADKQKEEPAESSAWEEARQEVLGAPDTRAVGPASVEPYNEEKVSRLKMALVDALKHAANIRHVKSSEGVTVCVIGSSQPGPGQAVFRRNNAGRGSALVDVLTVGTPQRSTLLTLRAKKPDIDAFAKGQMNADEFRQKVTAAIYQVDTGTGGFGYGAGAGSYGTGYGRSSR